MFRKSFKSAKCKTLVRMAMSRIKLLRNKRDMQLKQMRRDLSLLLQSGQDPSARIRVEHIIREQNIMAAYDIIELFCELIVARLPIIVSQSKCPVDLREALSSLIFAAPRCADIPELLDIRDLFGAKYGKEFVSAAAELRPDCGVNRTIIEKLSVKTPNGEVKLKLMKEIAKEYQVDWDPAESEAEFFKRPDNLLEGPNKFVGATNISGGSKKDHSPTVFGQKGESQSPDLHQNPSRLPFSSTSALPSQSPTTSGNQQSEKLSGWPLQSTSGRTNVQPVDPCQDFSVDRTLHSSSSTKHNSFSTAGTSNTSRQQGSHDLGVIKRNISGTSTGSPGVSNEDVVLCGDRDYNMYFKDTASAAKAAADSAEKAVAASRAAAQLAKQNNLQNRHQQAFDSFDPSLSDVETTDSCNFRMNRKPYLHQTQSFHGYDPYRMARVEGHAGNKNLSRSASGQITRENEALNSDDGCEMPVKRSGRRDASHHGNAVKLYSNSTPAMHNYDTMRSERQSFGSYEDNPLKESNTPSLLPSRRTEMVYSNNLASPIFDESDCTDSESDEEIEAQHFVSETRNMPRAELSSTSQAPTRPPPGVTFSTLNNSQPSTYAGLNSRGSHVHPKLPDYDALASRFESLKYQRK